MAPNPTIMQAVEKLGYRVTTGDVATQAGLEVNLAQQGLLALASEAGGHLQVSESGEIVYLFPKNFRSILQNKYFRLRLQEWWQKVWRVLFYLIRISFGIVLILSIILIVVTIIVIITATNSSRDSDDRHDSGGGGGAIYMPHFWFGPDFFWIFYPDYYDRRYEQRYSQFNQEPQMNFLEAVFSFIFGDGNPNFNLEERRWQTIAAVIRNNKGAVTAEQIAPYLDSTGQGFAQEYEEYMLPVLARFDGRPEVSPEGDIVYHFPELQTTAAGQRSKSVPAYLEEKPWRFSEAGSGQLMLAAGLGAVNLIGALVLGAMLRDGIVAAKLGGLVAFTQSIYGLLLGYGVGFLGIPLIRYFWVQWRNRQIEARNKERRIRSLQLNRADENEPLQRKLKYARQFANETVIRQEDLAYTTETDLLEQEVNQSARLDAEWDRRLNEPHS
ncbi:hypothetical protein BST81_22375 [Leptolyngbya sp. 'hensonii']|uniref:hypothetical protein n=1 Tax=Leptolyngbya sp. 'hensonii' TaxID=1922337 RepID=UPI00094FA6E9|nr:hypothetical protein [Leptolyngbya sp. 'hensonii']OLP16152.1 hypothetical protein BST81_22375 [Leptolyngbya sp. 'hensonii']